MIPEDEHDPQDSQTSGASDIPDDMSLALIEEQADRKIRRVWVDDICYFSVIDVIAMLTGSKAPRKYWFAMQKRITEDGFRDASMKCRPLPMTSRDGVDRETAAADTETLMCIILALPALRRRTDHKPLGQHTPAEKCGIYAIVNATTRDQYIGSSADMLARFGQHKALLRRGKHHAPRLQEAWDTYGEEAFMLVVLETLSTAEYLEAIEQQYIDQEQPAYNVATVARNQLSLPPISEERVQQVLLSLYEIQSATTKTPLFRVLREAIIYGIVKPGPHFAVLVQAEASGVDTWEALGAFIQQRQQAS